MMSSTDVASADVACADASVPIGTSYVGTEGTTLGTRRAMIMSAWPTMRSNRVPTSSSHSQIK